MLLSIQIIGSEPATPKEAVQIPVTERSGRQAMERLSQSLLPGLHSDRRSVLDSAMGLASETSVETSMKALTFIGVV